MSISLSGINWSGLEYRMDYCLNNNKILTMKNQWNINIIRLIITSYDYLNNISPKPVDGISTCTTLNYVDWIKTVATWCQNAGITLIICQWAETEQAGQVPLPDQTGTVTLWDTISKDPTFKNNPYIWFDIWNEPYNCTIDQWRLIADAAVYKIRSNGSNNICLVGGLNYCHDIYPWHNNYLPYSNVVYSQHMYDSSGPTTNFDNNIGIVLKDGHDVFIGETGLVSTLWTSTVLDWFKNVWLNWLAGLNRGPGIPTTPLGFCAWSMCGPPNHLLVSTAGDPSSTPTMYGQIVKDKLLINKIVLAYLAVDSDHLVYQKLNYDLISILVNGGNWAAIDNNGNLTIYNLTTYNPTDIVNYVHSKEKKCVLMTGALWPTGWTDEQVHTEVDQLLASPTARTNAINNLLNYVKSIGYDGVDNDIEHGHAINSVTSTSNKPLMVAFMQELYNTFKKDNPNYIISVSMPSGRVADNNKMWDVINLEPYVTYFNIRSYYFSFGPLGATYADYENMFNTMYSGINTSKTNLGVAYYGKRCVSTVNDVHQGTCDVGSLRYDKYFDNISSTYTRYWNDTAKLAWWGYFDTTLQKWVTWRFHDSESLSNLYQYVNDNHFSGIDIWAINFGNRTDLYNVIQQYLIQTQQQCLTPSYKYVIT